MPKTGTEPPEVWVIVPASRPHRVGNVLGNFARQSHPNKRLAVAENGAAVGAYAGLHGVTVVRSDPRAGAARNAALDAVGAISPGAFVVTMDDDDFYAPGYISEHLAASSPRAVTGKRWGWVKFNSGLVFFGGWEPGPTRGLLLGGTLGFYERPDLRFDESIDCGEDSAFCRLANGLGLSTVLLTAANYCLSREGDAAADHTHKAKDEKIWRYAGFHGIRGEGGRALCGGPPLQGPVRQ